MSVLRKKQQEESYEIDFKVDIRFPEGFRHVEHRLCDSKFINGACSLCLCESFLWRRKEEKEWVLFMMMMEKNNNKNKKNRKKGYSYRDLRTWSMKRSWLGWCWVTFHTTGDNDPPRQASTQSRYMHGRSRRKKEKSVSIIRNNNNACTFSFGHNPMAWPKTRRAPCTFFCRISKWAYCSHILAKVKSLCGVCLITAL